MLVELILDSFYDKTLPYHTPKATSKVHPDYKSYP